MFAVQHLSKKAYIFVKKPMLFSSFPLPKMFSAYCLNCMRMFKFIRSFAHVGLSSPELYFVPQGLKRVTVS